MEIKRTFKFDAAHNLVEYHGKCEALHGHTYRMVVKLAGKPNHEGMIIDFVMLKKMVKQYVLDIVDHAYLNDVIPQPTAEYIAEWAYKQLVKPLEAPNRSLISVEIYETEDCSATFTYHDV